MPVEHGKIGIPGNSKHLDSVELINDDGEQVEREVVVQGDSEDFEALRRVDLIPLAARSILYDEEGNAFTITNQVPVSDKDFATLLGKMDDLIHIQKGMLRLLEVAFEDDLSARDVNEGEI